MDNCAVEVTANSVKRAHALQTENKRRRGELWSVIWGNIFQRFIDAVGLMTENSTSRLWLFHGCIAMEHQTDSRRTRIPGIAAELAQFRFTLLANEWMIVLKAESTGCPPNRRINHRDIIRT